jgi:hypothetical protein
MFWDIMPCSLLKVDRRFGGARSLQLQSRKISQETSMKQVESAADYILWDVGPLLGNDREISSYTIAVAK